MRICTIKVLIGIYLLPYLLLIFFLLYIFKLRFIKKNLYKIPTICKINCIIVFSFRSIISILTKKFILMHLLVEYCHSILMTFVLK